MTTARTALPDLRARTHGRLLAPDHPLYEPSRRTFNAMAGGRPLAILQPEDTADIVAAVQWAIDADVGVGIRGGGNSVAGHPAPDGALLIDLSTWRGAEVDPAGRTAVALAGSRLMDLDAATAAYGLAAPSGTFVDTGIGGLPLVVGSASSSRPRGSHATRLSGQSSLRRRERSSMSTRSGSRISCGGCEGEAATLAW
jgi:hypothetical protein